MVPVKIGYIPDPPHLPFKLPVIPTMEELPHITERLSEIKPKPKRNSAKIPENNEHITMKGTIDLLMKQINMRKTELNFNAPILKRSNSSSCCSSSSSFDSDNSD